MTPHRSPPVTIALQHLALLPPDPATGVLVGVGALIAAHWNVHVAFLLLAVIIGGCLDLWTGARRARISQRLGGPERFDRQRLDDGVAMKGVVLAVIIFLGISLDGLASIAGDGLGLSGDLFRAYTPAMSALLAWRLLREVTSIKENVEHTPGGEGAIFPGVSRLIDALRHRMLQGGPLPERRWADDLSAEERAWLADRLDERRRGAA